MPLTDTQLVLLSAASQRDDGLLPRPAKLAGIALRHVESSLIKVGVAELVSVRSDQPSWRKDAAETPVGLRITPAGLVAIGLAPVVADADVEDQALQTATVSEVGGDHRCERVAEAHVQASGPGKPPRGGTKLAQLRGLIAAGDGATIEALTIALGWLPHTVRAALTRLRHTGLVITKSRNEQQQTVYRLTDSPLAEPADRHAANEPV